MKHLFLICLLTFLVCPDASFAKDKKGKRTLASISRILVSNEYCALIPKGAILYTPKHIKDKAKGAPKMKGTLVNWKTFLRKNSGWIHMHHVSMEEAAGKKRIRPEVIKAYQSIGKVVIAHNNGDLVSVNPKALKIDKE